MESNKRKQELLREFLPQLEKTSFVWFVWVAFLLVVIFFAIYALILQILRGHIITGMRDNVVWGVYIVNFIFFMGVSYAGALVSGSMHLFKTSWRGPILRIAELTTIVALCIGPLYILLCIGRLDRLPFLFMYPRIQSPITWDVIAISTDLIGCLIYLYLSFIRDFALMRDAKDIRLPKWRINIYKALALNYRDTPSQQKRIKNITNIMSAMIIAIAIIVYSVLAWIFSVTLQPGWHSTIFGPYFVIAAVFSGAGVMIILMRVFRSVFHLEKHITKKHFVGVGMILMVLSMFFAYFTFSEYLTKWYGSKKLDDNLIQILFTKYFWQFVFSNYVGTLLPIIIMGIPRFRSINSITVAAIVAVLALWVNRYLIVVPTLETPYLPIQDTRPDWIFYSATWIEWTLTFGGVAMFCFLFTLAAKIVPIIPVSEVADAELEMSEVIAQGQNSDEATLTEPIKKHIVLKKDDHEQ
ncbi:MAG: polysulfide reductase NrfD [Bacteroidetes bacterium]|nr:polysulfide reductase NrfD [Bacteroidota bacterium]